MMRCCCANAPTGSGAMTGADEESGQCFKAVAAAEPKALVPPVSKALTDWLSTEFPTKYITAAPVARYDTASKPSLPHQSE